MGQAWLAGIGKLVTCGHVVEPHMREAGSLIVTFPYSGNRYPIKEIRLHPSFLKQPDGLVKFDAALLQVELNEPELSARILPIVYDKVLPSQLSLTAVRYPVHLGNTARPSIHWPNPDAYWDHCAKTMTFIYCTTQPWLPAIRGLQSLTASR